MPIPFSYTQRARLGSRQEWIDEGEAIDDSGSAEILCVQILNSSSDTSRDEQGIPERKRMASLEVLRISPYLDIRQNNLRGSTLHIGQRSPGLILGEADRSQLATGRDELTTDLP